MALSMLFRNDKINKIFEEVSTPPVPLNLNRQNRVKLMMMVDDCIKRNGAHRLLFLIV